MIHIQLTAEERPALLQHTFLDSDGEALDLTGFVGELRWIHQGSGANNVVPVAIQPAEGKVSAHLTPELMAEVGVVEAAFWVVSDSGLTKYASDTYRLVLPNALGATTPLPTE